MPVFFLWLPLRNAFRTFDWGIMNKKLVELRIGGGVEKLKFTIDRL